MKRKGEAAAASDAFAPRARHLPSVCRNDERCGAFGLLSNPTL
ncbi:hypothetical protein [Paraburkholderia haematera]|nr:hypothetical protein [Paraburkholderia haematera]